MSKAFDITHCCGTILCDIVITRGKLGRMKRCFPITEDDAYPLSQALKVLSSGLVILQDQYTTLYLDSRIQQRLWAVLVDCDATIQDVLNLATRYISPSPGNRLHWTTLGKSQARKLGVSLHLYMSAIKIAIELGVTAMIPSDPNALTSSNNAGSAVYQQRALMKVSMISLGIAALRAQTGQFPELEKQKTLERFLVESQAYVESVFDPADDSASMYRGCRWSTPAETLDEGVGSTCESLSTIVDCDGEVEDEELTRCDGYMVERGSEKLRV